MLSNERWVFWIEISFFLLYGNTQVSNIWKLEAENLEKNFQLCRNIKRDTKWS